MWVRFDDGHRPSVSPAEEADVSVGSSVARRANVRVRLAEADDAQSVAELLLPLEPHVPGGPSTGRGGRTGRGERPMSLEVAADHLRTRFSDPDFHAYVAADTSDPAEPIVGVVVARFDDAGLLAPTRVLSVGRLVVASRMRRRGIGRALLSACIELAEGAGVHYLLSSSHPSARDANRYLARVGFASMATRRMAPVSTVRRALGLPALGLVVSSGADARLARRRLPRRAVSASGMTARSQDVAHPGA